MSDVKQANQKFESLLVVLGVRAYKAVTGRFNGIILWLQQAMQQARFKLTLDQPARYEIKVPGELDPSWSEWAGGMAVRTECEGDRPPVTTLSGTVVDQAALLGLLRRLYAVGLPLISVVCLTADTTSSLNRSSSGHGRREK